MPSTRRSAKTVITDMSNEQIKAFEQAKDEYRRDLARDMIFTFEMVAFRMDWSELHSKLKRWRSETLRAGITQTKGS